MTTYTFFRRGAEWLPGDYMSFGLPQGRTQIAEFFNEPVRFGPNFVSWTGGSDPRGPQVIPGPGAKPGGTDPTARRILVERQPQEKRQKVENNVRNALTMILAAYYS